MITVTVKYFGGFVNITGKSRESVKLQDGQTVGDLTARLSREYGGKLEELLKPATGHRRALVVRDGVGLNDDSVLTDGDHILVLFPVAGG
jgi:MoaD family protein